MSIWYDAECIDISKNDINIGISTYNENDAEYVSVPVKEMRQKLNMENELIEQKLADYEKALNTISGLKGDYLHNAPLLAEMILKKYGE